MYDVIIIGAGFTGVCAGALLSKDLDVLVLDENAYIGGRSATRTPKEWGWADREDYDVDFGHHVFATNNYLEFILDKTKATRFVDIQRINTPLFYKDGSFHKPPNGFIDQLRAYPFMPFRSKLKLRKFLKFVKKVSYSEVMDEWIYRSDLELFEEFGLDEYCKELLTDGFVAGYQTTTQIDELSGGDLIFCLKAYLKGVQKYDTPLFAAKGGVANIAKALASVIKENGGKIVLNSRVDSINIQDGSAKGVQLEDGKKAMGRHILYAAPVCGLLDLLDEDALNEPYRDRLKKARKNANGLFLIMGGCKEPLLDEPVGTWIMVPKTEVSNVDSYYLVYEFDRKLEQAPEDRYFINIAVEPDEEELKDQKSLVKKMKGDMKTVFPDIDFEQDFDWLSSYYFPIVDGLKRTTDWYYERRPGPETPIEDLYVAGDSAHQFSTGVDGSGSSAIFAVEEITGKDIIDLEEFYSL